MHNGDKLAKNSNSVSFLDTTVFQHALLNEIIAFVAVADCNSFTQAAENLQTTKSSVGKAIQKLEADMQVKLFHRSTRSVRLTEEGAIYLHACRKALEAINSAKQQFDARQAEPAGTLRVNAPIGIGHAILTALNTFTEEYPQVTVELLMSDKFVEAIEDELDVVVRIGELADSAMVAKKLCILKSVLCASPAYLEKYTAPTTLQELQAHKGVLFRGPNGRVRPWSFKRKNRTDLEHVMPKAAAILTDGRAMVDATINGVGIAQLYDKAISQPLEYGRLVQLPCDAAPDGPPMHALIPAGRVMPPKTRVFIEFLQTLFSN